MPDRSNDVKITPGTTRFNHMIFRLRWKINDKNVQVLDYNRNSLYEIQKNVFVMPAYIDKKFNLFVVVSKLIGDNWILSFSRAKIENHNEVTDLSEPMAAGRGLNLLGKRSPKDANNLLRYFNTLVSTKRGEWCLMSKNK